MIPTIGKILTGDKTKAAHYLGLAKRQLDILLNDMSLAIPTPLKIADRTLKLKNGGFIEVNVCYNIHTMRIHIPVIGEEKFNQAIEVECICNCNFTVGQIIEKQVNTINDASLYKVKVCSRKEYYITYENILASDFTDYVDGQPVILIPYNEATFLCCSSSADATGCNPSKSELVLDNALWRTALRIIPWCASTVPQWLSK